MGVSFEEPEVVSERRKDVRRVPCKLREQLADGGGTTNLYRPLASLVNNQAQLQNCLDIYKPQGPLYLRSVVLLVIGVEKKTCPISFYDRSDRHATNRLLAFIHSGDN